MDISVAVDALTSEAKIWDGIGDSLDDMKADVNGLDLHRGAFSFAGTGVADAYASLYSQVLELLQQGSNETHGGADALRAVRRDFESNEAAIKDALAGLWDPAN